MNPRQTVTVIEWIHPTYGRVRETLCPEHEPVVLGALRQLGVGCSGTSGIAGAACSRCVAQLGDNARGPAVAVYLRGRR